MQVEKMKVKTIVMICAKQVESFIAYYTTE